MEVSYRREMNHNYLMIRPDDLETAGYECRMMAGNNIDGLLKFRLRYEEGGRRFYYEITSKQPLCRLAEQKPVTGEQIKKIVWAVSAVLQKTEEYLLKEEQILLEPEYIYIEPDTFQIYFCMIPGYSKSFPDALTKLFQYLLEKIDYKDKDGVVLAYHLYHESLKENYGMSDLLKFLSGTDEIFEPEEPIREEIRDETGYGEEVWEYKNQEEKRREEYEIPEKNAREKGGSKNRKKKKSRKNFDFSEAGNWLFITAGAEFFLWGVMGEEILFQYGIWLAAGSAALFLLKQGIFNLYERKKREEKEDDISQTVSKESLKESQKESTGEIRKEISGENSFMIPKKRRKDGGKEKENPRTFEIKKPLKKKPEEESIRRDWNTETTWEDEITLEPEKAEQDEKREYEEMQTTLLADFESTGSELILESLQKEREDIVIPYVPFVIGKHEDMTDYSLSHPTISRLHAKLDQKEDECTITDLNSTNGTSVNGRLLQANETVYIKDGDRVYFAEIGYRFRKNR